MVNKKGYIKTLEAVIAIILIATVSFILISQHVERPLEPPLIVQDAMSFINKKIEFDESLRSDVIRVRLETKEKIESIINENKPKNYDFTCLICSNSNICFPVATPLEKNIYVSDVFISSSEKKQDPKIVRIWFWEKPTTREDLICYDDCLNKCAQK